MRSLLLLGLILKAAMACTAGSSHCGLDDDCCSGTCIVFFPNTYDNYCTIAWWIWFLVSIGIFLIVLVIFAIIGAMIQKRRRQELQRNLEQHNHATTTSYFAQSQPNPSKTDDEPLIGRPTESGIPNDLKKGEGASIYEDGWVEGKISSDVPAPPS